MGDAKAGLQHLQRAMELFDPDVHRSAPFRLGPSPGVAAPVVSALFRWWLGQPDTAKALAAGAIEVADRLGHPYTAAYTYFHVAVLDIWNRDHAAAGQRAQRVVEIARRHDYQIWLALGMVVEGVSQAALDDPAKGLQRTTSGVARYEGIQTPPVFWPLVLSLKADAYARAGKLADAAAALDQALALAGEPNWLSASFVAQKGDVLISSGQAVEGIAALRRAADEARALGALMIQLRALTRLAATAAGRQRDEAGAELAALLDQFEEGADNPDVRDARLTVAAAGAA
jgi:tetratricopeptide (TPR) repeat protein